MEKEGFGVKPKYRIFYIIKNVISTTVLLLCTPESAASSGRTLPALGPFPAPTLRVCKLSPFARQQGETFG